MLSRLSVNFVTCGILVWALVDSAIVNYKRTKNGALFQYRHVETFSLEETRSDSDELVRHVRSAETAARNGKLGFKDQVMMGISAFLFVMCFVLGCKCLILGRFCCCVIKTAKAAKQDAIHRYVPGVRLDINGQRSYYHPSPAEIDAVIGIGTGVVPGILGDMLDVFKIGNYVGVPEEKVYEERRKAYFDKRDYQNRNQNNDLPPEYDNWPLAYDYSPSEYENSSAEYEQSSNYPGHYDNVSNIHSSHHYEMSAGLIGRFKDNKKAKGEENAPKRKKGEEKHVFKDEEAEDEDEEKVGIQTILTNVS